MKFQINDEEKNILAEFQIWTNTFLKSNSFFNVRSLPFYSSYNYDRYGNLLIDHGRMLLNRSTDQETGRISYNLIHLPDGTLISEDESLHQVLIDGLDYAFRINFREYLELKRHRKTKLEVKRSRLKLAKPESAPKKIEDLFPQAKPKLVAIIAGSQAMSLAMQNTLKRIMPGSDVVSVENIANAPRHSVIACLGMPCFISGSVGIYALIFGSKYVTSDAERANHWKILRNPQSTIDEITPLLSEPKEYFIMPPCAINSYRCCVTESRLKIFHSKTLEEERDAYKAAFELITSLF